MSRNFKLGLSKKIAEKCLLKHLELIACEKFFCDIQINVRELLHNCMYLKFNLQQKFKIV